MPVWVPTYRVLRLCNPFKAISPWGTGRVTKKMVAQALRRSLDLASAPVEPGAGPHEHAARIAYLAQYGWDDALEVDVGIPSMGCHVNWAVTDGNHRLAAAAFRGDADILASVGGCLDTAFKLFGVDCQEKQLETEAMDDA